MKKIGNTQSGALLVEMTDAEYEKLTAGAAVPVDAFMTVRMTVKDCVDYCAGKFAKIHPARASFQRNAGLFAIAREGCLSGLQRVS